MGGLPSCHDASTAFEFASWTDHAHFKLQHHAVQTEPVVAVLDLLDAEETYSASINNKDLGPKP